MKIQKYKTEVNASSISERMREKLDKELIIYKN